MAHLEGGFFDEPRTTTPKTAFSVDQDNVLDLKKDIEKDTDLKQLKTETKGQLTELDDAIERRFDAYYIGNSNVLRTLTLDELQKKFNDSSEAGMLREELKNLVREKEENSVSLVEKYQFKLNEFAQTITQQPTVSPSLTTKPTVAKEQLYDLKKDVVVGYPGSQRYSQSKIFIKDEDSDTGYSKKKLKLADVYDEDLLAKYTEKVFEKDPDMFKKRDFKVNLSMTTGLGMILETIATTGGGLKNKDTYADPKDLRTFLKDQGKEYTHESGWDNEIRKIAKIIENLSADELSDMLNLLKTRVSSSRSIKETYNSQELLNAYTDPEGKISLVSEKNLWDFVCDYDGNGKLDQKDGGSIMGQQMLFHINQAIDLAQTQASMEGISGATKGEETVIKNIIRAIDINDPDAQRMNAYFLKTPCTKANLLGYFREHPTALTFFRSAIERINGGTKDITPDLTSLLVGKSGEDILNRLRENGSQQLLNFISTNVDVRSKSHPELAEAVRRQGKNTVSKGIFSYIMENLHAISLSAKTGNSGDVPNVSTGTGIEASWAKEQLIQNMISTIITTGINVTDLKNGNYRFTLGYGKENHSRSIAQPASQQHGDRVARRGVFGGPEFGPQGFSFMLGLGGALEQQINYERVITANLEEVSSAKYIGGEAGIYSRLFGKSYPASIEASAGITMERNIVMGINQVNAQYQEISDKLFSLEGIDDEKITSKSSLKKVLERNLESISSDNGKVNERYRTFIKNNENRLKNDIRFVCEYLETIGAFEQDGIFASLGSIDRKSAISDILSMLQSGNIQTRRNELLANLSGDVQLTGLSFGVISLPVVLGRKPIAHKGPDGNANTFNAYNTEVDSVNTANAKEDLRFGLMGLYLAARLSTWKTTYRVNENQVLTAYRALGNGTWGSALESKQGNLEHTADYLEGLFFGMVDVEKQQDNTLKVRSKDGKTPLLQLLNISYSEQAKGQFSFDGATTLVIGNVGEIGAYTISQTNGVRGILSLGSKKINETTRISGKMDATNMTGIELKETIQPWTKDLIKNKILVAPQFTQQDQTEILKLFTDEGSLVTPVGTITGPFTRDTLVINKKKNASGNIEYSVDTMIYVKQLDYKIFGITLNDYTVSGTTFKPGRTIDLARPSTTPVFEYTSSDPVYKQTERQLNSGRNTLYTLDSKNPLAFSTFTEAMVQGDLSRAVPALQQILKKNPSLASLSTRLANATPSMKAYICAKCMQYFAYEKIYADQGKESIRNISHLSLSSFLSLTGPSKQALPEDIHSLLTTAKEDLLNTIESDGEVPYSLEAVHNTNPNIFGLTSFYRSKEESKRGYVMTALGSTDIFAGKVQALEDPDKKVSSWLGENIKSDTLQQKLLVDSLVKRIGKINNQDPRTLFGPNADTKILEALTTGSSDILCIDNIKRKLTITSKPVFYFMGECVNESIGLQIDKIELGRYITINKNEAEADKKYISPVHSNTTTTGSLGYAHQTDFWGRYTHQLNHKTYLGAPTATPDPKNIDPGNPEHPDPEFPGGTKEEQNTETGGETTNTDGSNTETETPVNGDGNTDGSGTRETTETETPVTTDE